MTDNIPIASSGAREPEKRPRPLPRKLRQAIRLMIHGAEDDPGGRPLDFVEAAKIAGIRPALMRSYLDRPMVRSYLLAERRTFRLTVCAGNERALRGVRDTTANAMAQVAAVRALEQLDAPAAATNVNILNIAQAGYVIDLSGRRGQTIELQADNDEKQIP